MKKKLLVLTMLMALAMSISSLSTQATSNGEKDKGYINVSTTANTEIAPDVAELAFAIKTSDNKSMQKATLMNKDISEKVYTILKEF